MLAGQIDSLKALVRSLTTHEQVANAVILVGKLDQATQNALNPVLAVKIQKLGGEEVRSEESPAVEPDI